MDVIYLMVEEYSSKYFFVDQNGFVKFLKHEKYSKPICKVSI